MPAQMMRKIFLIYFRSAIEPRYAIPVAFNANFKIKNWPPRKKVALFSRARFFKTGGKSLKHLRYCVLMYIFIEWNIQELIYAQLQHLYIWNFARF